MALTFCAARGNRGGTFAATAAASVVVEEGVNVDIRDTASNILSRTGDAIGVVAFATDTFDLFVADGKDNWAKTINRPF